MSCLCVVRGLVLAAQPGEVLVQGGGVERTVQAQGPGERTTPLSELEAPESRVHVGTTTREPPARIGDNTALDRHHAQQVSHGRPAPASHAQALRGRRIRPTGLAHATPSLSSPVGWASLRMSIRHPVSRAASRAFCPSLPMARESW